jgi:hypothetical protein
MLRSSDVVDASAGARRARAHAGALRGGVLRAMGVRERSPTKSGGDLKKPEKGVVAAIPGAVVSPAESSAVSPNSHCFNCVK